MTPFGRLLVISLALPAFGTAALAAPPADPSAPHLRRQGAAPQLVVDGKPLLMLAGELHNSSASGVAYIERLWPRLKALGLNTVLAPVSWELTEPAEGRFYFALVDALIAQARKYDQKLVLLWFGSWKNGVSSYAPGWVLSDTKRFPRARGSSNRNTKDVLSAVSAANRDADARAFAALLRHLKAADGRAHTVVMVQVENEAGIMPEPRDLSEEADAAWRAAVPARLTEYLAARRDGVHPELRHRWEKSGARASGTWGEVFGDGPEGAEVFSTWHYATYTDAVAAAGKAEYDLPMYVNAWLDNGGKPGSYPTGGPVAHMHDVWRAAAPHVDLLAPDIYLPDFKGITAAFARGGNPLFVPEAAPDAEAAARAYWAFASRDALGFSPFGIESLDTGHPLAATYDILRQLLPVIASAQGTGRMAGIYRKGREGAPGRLKVGDYRAEVRYQDRLPDGHPPVGGLVVQTGGDEFLVAGYGFSVRFGATTPGPRHTEILSVELGHFDAAGAWARELRLNGDETGANSTARIPPFTGNTFLGATRPMILKVKVYRHD